MDNFRHLPFSSRRYFVSATGMVVDTDSNELPEKGKIIFKDFSEAADHLDVPIGVVGVLASKNAEINSFKLRLHVLSEHCSRPAE